MPDGQVGELVFTTVEREGTPLLRYRSGDLGYRMPDEQCPCRELPTDRISRIMGRADDMLFLGSGENIYPLQFETALLEVQGLNEFQVVIHRDGFRDQVCVRVESAVAPEVMEGAIRDSLYQHMPYMKYDIEHSQTVSPLKIEYVSAGTFQRESPVKHRRLLDKRGQH